jgi:hypothetical protein
MTLLHQKVDPTYADAPDAEALIREARHLRRQRWLVGLCVLLIAGTGIGVGVGVSGGSGGHAPRPSAKSGGSAETVAFPPGVSILNLTNSDKYGDIALVGGKLLLYGPKGEESDPALGSTCNSAVVNPSTLKLSDMRTSSCADPALEGQRVLPVITVEPKVPFGKGGGVATMTVRISHVVTGSPGYQLGAVVMTFPQASTGWPVWVYGDGDLWLYDAYNPGGADLLRISASTGAVIQRITMPPIARPIVAFDDDGFWLAPAVNSTGPAVYHVTPGASTAVTVLRLTGAQYASWMVAAAHTVWLDVSSGGKTGTIWRLVGNGAAPTSHVTLSSFDNEVETQGGASTMVGDAANGLWTIVVNSAGTQQQVIRIDPTSATYGTIASLRPSYSSSNVLIDGDFWKAVTFRGSMFLLDPPTSAGTYPYQPEGFSAFYRITPRST